MPISIRQLAYGTIPFCEMVKNVFYHSQTIGGYKNQNDQVFNGKIWQNLFLVSHLFLVENSLNT